MGKLFLRPPRGLKRLPITPEKPKLVLKCICQHVNKHVYVSDKP